MITKNVTLIIALLFILLLISTASAQQENKPATILTGAALTQVVPTSFYFAGQSAPTQMRNASAVKFADHKIVIAGLVDTSGYATDIAAKYQGFFITDSKIKIGGRELAVGAYGFGFTNDGKFNVQDIGGAEILLITAATDEKLRRPRPLIFIKSANEIRLYGGRNYIVLAR